MSTGGRPTLEMGPVEPATGGSATAADWITPEIRGLIINGVIRPGERISVKSLEKRFGVSHIPIREALRQLEAEGLVTLLPQRGAIATRVSSQELEDVYDLRRIIEPEVARRAAQRATPADHALLKSAMQRLRDNEPAGHDRFFDAHWDFHWAVLRPGATAEIDRTLHQLWKTSERYIKLTRGSASDEAHHQHELITAAFVNADAAGLSDLVSRHLLLTGGAIRRMFDERGLEFAGLGD